MPYDYGMVGDGRDARIGKAHRTSIAPQDVPALERPAMYER